MNRSKKIAEYALYTALAFLFGYLENLFPLPLPFPGMKIGFANLIFDLILYPLHPFAVPFANRSECLYFWQSV